MRGGGAKGAVGQQLPRRALAAVLHPRLHRGAARRRRRYARKEASAEAYAGRGLRAQCRGIPPDAYIEADPTYFRSILTNLLDNSAKYRKGEQGRATIAGERAGRQIRLFVDDDGPGAPEAALPKLFDAFYRNDPSRKNPDQGSGLGLAIAAKSLERMGGSIRAENLPGDGLRMTIHIPLAGRD